MSAAQTAAQLTEFARRGAGTDAERRAARGCARRPSRRRREATIETFWCRPNWALAHSWHLLLAIAGSLVMVSDPSLGGALVLVALVSILADWLTGRSPGRRLTPERASQNVVSRPLAADGPAADPDAGEPLRVIVTANYDAGRAGLAHRPWLRRCDRAAAPPCRRRPVHPGLAGVARHRATYGCWRGGPASRGQPGRPARRWASSSSSRPSSSSSPSRSCWRCAAADFGPSAADNAAGTAVALALTRALDAAPPRRVAVELVLQGAGDGQMIGLTAPSARRAARSSGGPTRSCWGSVHAARVPRAGGRATAASSPCAITPAPRGWPRQLADPKTGLDAATSRARHRAGPACAASAHPGDQHRLPGYAGPRRGLPRRAGHGRNLDPASTR